MTVSVATPSGSDLIGYQYVVWRLVPCVEREEFLNVGVVVYAQMADFLEGAFALDADRVFAFAPQLDLDAIAEQLEALQAALRGQPCPGRPQMAALGQRFGWVSAPRSTMLRPGPLHGGVTRDPAATLHSLLSRLVLPQQP